MREGQPQMALPVCVLLAETSHEEGIRNAEDGMAMATGRGFKVGRGKLGATCLLK
jgi:hypothetical protein